MATRSALRVTRLAPVHAGQLTALVDREPVTNVYLRSELRLGFEAGDWWGAFEEDELTSVELGWSRVVPYMPDIEAASTRAPASRGRQPAFARGPQGLGGGAPQRVSPAADGAGVARSPAADGPR